MGVVPVGSPSSSKTLPSRAPSIRPWSERLKLSEATFLPSLSTKYEIPASTLKAEENPPMRSTRFDATVGLIRTSYSPASGSFAPTIFFAFSPALLPASTGSNPDSLEAHESPWPLASSCEKDRMFNVIDAPLSCPLVPLEVKMEEVPTEATTAPADRSPPFFLADSIASPASSLSSVPTASTFLS